MPPADARRWSKIEGDFFSDLTTLALAKSLDGAGLRHRVIADNVANVETPGFTRSEVRFEEKLREALASGDEEQAAGRLNGVEPDIQPDYSAPARPDGNNVSMDREMAELTKNTLRYEALVQLLNLKNIMVRTAITEGRR